MKPFMSWRDETKNLSHGKRSSLQKGNYVGLTQVQVQAGVHLSISAFSVHRGGITLSSSKNLLVFHIFFGVKVRLNSLI